MMQTVLYGIEIICLLTITSLIMTVLKNIKKTSKREAREREGRKIFVTFLKAGGGKLCISVDQIKRVEAYDEKRTYLYIGHDPKTGRYAETAMIQEPFGDVIFRLYPYINLSQRGGVAIERNNKTIEAQQNVKAVDVEALEEAEANKDEEKNGKTEKSDGK